MQVFFYLQKLHALIQFTSELLRQKLKNYYLGGPGISIFVILTHKTQSNHLKTILNRFYGQK